MAMRKLLTITDVSVDEIEPPPSSDVGLGQPAARIPKKSMAKKRRFDHFFRYHKSQLNTFFGLGVVSDFQ